MKDSTNYVVYALYLNSALELTSILNVLLSIVVDPP